MTSSHDDLAQELAAARAKIASLEAKVGRAIPLDETILRLMAHELRSPLAPVLTAVQLLEEETSLSDEFRRWLAVIRRNVLVEAWMVDDAMDLLRIRSGTPPHPSERAGIHEILRSALDAAAGEMKHKNMEPKLELLATSTEIHVHPPRVTHAFWNLLRAALKSGSSAAPLVVRTRDEIDAVVVEIVQPAGSGGYAAKIVEGVVGDDAALATQGAPGLAVLFARELLGSLGIALQARVEGTSLVYAATIPTAHASASATPAPSAAAARPSAKKTRILLVDDHEDSLTMMELVLARFGYEVVSARSVESALAAAATEGGALDILVSDLTLPDGSGIDLLRKLSPLPGVAVSGLARSEDIAASRAAGFAEHLVKPVLPEAVDSAVRRVLGR